jgi:hypothetical protein
MLRRLLLLTLPLPLLLLAIYIPLEGQIKLSGIIILALFMVLLECIAVFFYRFIAYNKRGRINRDNYRQ